MNDTQLMCRRRKRTIHADRDAPDPCHIAFPLQKARGSTFILYQLTIILFFFISI